MPSELRIVPEAGTAEPIEPATIGEPLPPALLLTREELAHELRTRPKTITRRDQTGELPRAVKIGRAKRWPRQTIAAWIATGCPKRALRPIDRDACDAGDLTLIPH